MNNEINNINEEEVPLGDLDHLIAIKEFSCTVSYDEDREKMFSLELEVSSNSDDVNEDEIKEMLSEMIKNSFDEGVGNLIYMMKDINKQENK